MSALLDNASSNDFTPSVLFAYNSVSVHVGPDGLIDAKDMHRAAGADPKKAPWRWSRRQEVQDLIENLSGNSPDLESLRTEEGRNGGTWLCRELAVAYASYLDADFYLFVIRVFLAAGDGQLAPAAPATPPELLAALARLDRMEASVEAMHATVGEVIRPAHVRDRVRQDHRAIVTDMDGGRCPCCGDNQVVERVRRINGATFQPEWTGGYCVSRYRGVHLAGLRDTWPVCMACRYRLFSREFHRHAQPNFDRYQRASVDGWLRKRRPDLFGAG